MTMMEHTTQHTFSFFFAFCMYFNRFSFWVTWMSSKTTSTTTKEKYVKLKIVHPLTPSTTSTATRSMQVNEWASGWNTKLLIVIDFKHVKLFFFFILFHYSISTSNLTTSSTWWDSSQCYCRLIINFFSFVCRLMRPTDCRWEFVIRASAT